MSAKALAQVLATAGANSAAIKGGISNHENPAAAFAAARERAGDSDRILVFGSFLTVADVMPILKR